MLPALITTAAAVAAAVGLRLAAAAAAAAASDSAGAASHSRWPLDEEAAFARCNIPVEAHLSLADFRRLYKGRGPVIFSRGANETAHFASSTTPDKLRAGWGHLPVVLASSNSFSYDKRASTLGSYLDEHMAPQSPDRLANETWYLFGDTPVSGDWSGLVSQYALPLDAKEDQGIVAWGVGAKFSGVSFHTHGAAFAEAVHGRKRWYLSPPGLRPSFQPDRSQLQWVIGHVAAGGGSGSGILECTAHPGQVLYVPPSWWHATLNLDGWGVFVSVFTLEPWESQAAAHLAAGQPDGVLGALLQGSEPARGGGGVLAVGVSEGGVS